MGRCKVETNLVKILRLRKVCLFIRDKSIPNAWLGENILRAFGVGFQFLAQLPHVDAQILGVICVGWSRDVRKDALHVFAWIVQRGRRIIYRLLVAIYSNDLMPMLEQMMA